MSKTALTFQAAMQVKDACICLSLQRAARSVARLHDEALRSTGLTNGQFGLMMLLLRPDPISISQLASELAMDRTTLTASLKPLERRRLVGVTVDPKDKRLRNLKLTAEGLRALEAALPLWRKVQDDTQRRKGSDVTVKLRAALRAYSD